MAVVINGTTGIDTIQDSIVTDAKLASTLDISGKTVTYGLTDADLPAGSVLQVVQATTISLASASNTTFVSTNLSATITPSSTSSKILIIGQHGSARINGSSNGIKLRLMRGGTFLLHPVYEFLYSTVGIDGAIPFHYLDSPSTTSATTYLTEFALLTGASSTGQINPNSVPAVIILMEISA